MRKKTEKRFDCVKMKNEIQNRLWSEFESRRDEFATYSEFIQSQVKESDWCQRMKAKLSGGKQ